MYRVYLQFECLVNEVVVEGVTQAFELAEAYCPGVYGVLMEELAKKRPPFEVKTHQGTIKICEETPNPWVSPRWPTFDALAKDLEKGIVRFPGIGRNSSFMEEPSTPLVVNTALPFPRPLAPSSGPGTPAWEAVAPYSATKQVSRQSLELELESYKARIEQIQTALAKLETDELIEVIHAKLEKGNGK